MNNEIRFGDLLNQLRRQAGLSLREFAKKSADDPSNVSRIENSLRPAPGDDVTERYAKALNLLPGTEEWTRFFDVAALSKRELPKDITDAELLSELPVFLRTIRGKRPTKEGLIELKDTIFKALKP